jgi:tetratricopeptide (TPR) repeat protein
VKTGPIFGFTPLGWGLCLAILLPCVPATVAADDFPKAFEQANRLYEQGRFAEAAAAYEKILAGGRGSAAVHFNLGNALFKAGHVGKAIVSYRLAEQIAPRDADIRANLQFARNSVEGGASRRPERWRSWLERLTLDEWTVLATGSYWIWLVLLALGQWRSDAAKTLRGYTATAGGTALTLALCLGISLYGSARAQTAIVVSPEAVVHYGPLDESQKSYTARDGTELTVVDQKGDWVQVLDGANRSGWLRRDQIVILPGLTNAASSSSQSKAASPKNAG